MKWIPTKFGGPTFAIGLVAAGILGAGLEVGFLSDKLIYGITGIAGLLVGLMNVKASERKEFLIACIALVVCSGALLAFVGNVWEMLASIAKGELTFFSLAAIVPAIAHAVSKGKN